MKTSPGLANSNQGLGSETGASEAEGWEQTVLAGSLGSGVWVLWAVGKARLGGEQQMPLASCSPWLLCSWCRGGDLSGEVRLERGRGVGCGGGHMLYPMQWQRVPGSLELLFSDAQNSGSL